VIPRRLWVPRVARTLGAGHRVLYRLSGGRVGRELWSLPVVLLTTTGRTTGKPRTTPLCSFRDGTDFVVVASFGGLDRPPSWWLNLERNPQATIQLGRRRYEVRASTAEGGERARLWAEITAVAPGYLHYAELTTREIPVVVLRPEWLPGRPPA
jgi:deazaflavin-dependent oxidoreductase (nitroreductase family)